jgi:Zn-dependent M28 family amino/carboxypeptidase
MRNRLFLVVAIATIASLIALPTAAGDDISASQGYRKAVTAQQIRTHLEALDRIGAGSNRVGGSPEYEASADYVTAQLQSAGYTVTNHFFDFVYNADRTPAVLTQVSPDPTTYLDGVDFSSMTYSPNGDVSAQVWAVDLVLPHAPSAGATTSGCETSDFAGFPAGAIALVQRGTCTFEAKGVNAAAAGASAVVVFNDGGDAGRFGMAAGTLSQPQTHNAPVVGTTHALGADLANGVANGNTGSVARVRVDRVNELRTTRNLIAERAGALDPSNVVVVGAHLDSVPRGPGVQDNGSGSATVLELARVMAERGIEPRNTVRFMWFGAEEFGLLGSRAYVTSLSAAELARIRAMLNFDMIASPNFVRFVYDGDNSAFPANPPAIQPGPPGSGEIERLFRAYFDAVGLQSSQTPFNGRSDYGPFITAGIPGGGLFTGAEGVKTAEEAAVYGGTAGRAYDHCYHLACDTVDNVNMTALDQMSDAAAHVALTLGKRNFAKNPLTTPAEDADAASILAAAGPNQVPTGDPGLNAFDYEQDRSKIRVSL